MEMMPTTPATSPARPQEQARDPAAPASDFQTFLMLLTAQMRNQDPLKPIESTEFVAQLASFSAVEQQIRSNDRLDRIVEALSGGSAAGLAEWIGREVRVPAAANFQGVPVEVAVTPHPGADAAVLVVRNAFDQVVARRAADPAKDTLSWDGLDDSGQMQPHGSYRFGLESYAGGALIASDTGQVFAAVTEVRLENSAPRLVLAGGDKVGLDAVTAVR